MSVKKSDRSLWLVLTGFSSDESYSEVEKCLRQVVSDVSQRVNQNPASPVFWIPIEQTGDKKTTQQQQQQPKLRGFALIQAPNREYANAFRDNYWAHKALNRFNVKCYLWNEVKEKMKVSDEYQKISKGAFLEERNLYWWLLDKNGQEGYRDQYVVRYRGQQFEETIVYWNDDRIGKTGRIESYDGRREHANREEMTKNYVQWSPKGSYLASFHLQGIQLWGGPEWTKLQRFEHWFVDRIDWSPDETKMITCNSVKQQNRDGHEFPPVIYIWNPLTGECLREFGEEMLGPLLKLRRTGWWPIFKWGAKDKFFAQIATSKKNKTNAKLKDIDRINIFDGEQLTRLDKSAHPAPNVFDIAFSPTDDYLAYCSRALGNDAGKVTIISLPSKKPERVQTLGFDAGITHLYWQSQGKFLAVTIGHMESKRLRKNSIGILSVHQEHMPWRLSETLSKLTYFAWEPDTNRYGILHNDIDNPDVSFFTVNKSGPPTHLFTLPKRKTNNIYWAPRGGRCVVAHVDRENKGRNEAQLEFVDLALGPTRTVTRTHEGAVELYWCPSGRYVITAATQPISTTTSGDDTGYIVWSFQGEQLFKHQIPFFFQILWRPRPKEVRLETPEEEKQCEQMLVKEYYSLFEQCDADVRRQHQSKFVQINQKKLAAWNALQEKWQKKTKEISKQRAERRGYSSEGDDNDFEVTVVEQEKTEKFEERKINHAVLSRIMNGEKITIVDIDEMEQKEDFNTNTRDNFSGGRPNYAAAMQKDSDSTYNGNRGGGYTGHRGGRGGGGGAYRE